MPEELDRLFQEVKHSYFPSWDAKEEWKASLFDNEILVGYCDRSKKAILVNTKKWSNCVKRGDHIGLSVLLIHEITHAVVREQRQVDHGDKFKSRLRKVAAEARAKGNIYIADRLIADLSFYE
ncbi:hypothetical protein Dform_01125 [Dehalogenimonas formicexedens]|uniref:SprT-like family protein n=1 Tax=Dehalogenimonas formicexedens TaxID=1839801 RepID=A0A1P8F7K2_9CHLR|nr:hypothetical protein [Dehalogenimonas formicexedens]APV44459.1 hypothetical protein Dform_01125 [Dehalogenimonas formicexedens]